MSKWSYIERVRAITCTFMHGFQNNFAQLLSLCDSISVYIGPSPKEGKKRKD